MVLTAARIVKQETLKKVGSFLGALFVESLKSLESLFFFVCPQPG